MFAAHRSTLRRRLTRASAATAAAAVGMVMVAVANPVHADASDSVLGHLNGLRAAHGLRTLTETGTLNSIAAGHSAAMARAGSLFHNGGLTGEVHGWRVLGENVGMGPSVGAIDAAFDGSPEHYANEVNPAYSEVGIGMASDARGYVYITVDFEAPYGSTPVHTPAPAPIQRAPVRRAPVVAHPVVRTPVHTAARPLVAPRRVAAPVITHPAATHPVAVRPAARVVPGRPATPALWTRLMQMVAAPWATDAVLTTWLVTTIAG